MRWSCGSEAANRRVDLLTRQRSAPEVGAALTVMGLGAMGEVE